MTQNDADREAADMSWIDISICRNATVIADFAPGWTDFLDEHFFEDCIDCGDTELPDEVGTYRWSGFKIGSWEEGDHAVVTGGTFARHRDASTAALAGAADAFECDRCPMADPGDCLYHGHCPHRDGPLPDWRCFHCGEVFTDRQAAATHFGADEGKRPACLIKGAEGGLLKALRDAEAQADEAIQRMHDESTDAAKAYHRQRCRHTQALMSAEEVGYERGLRDGRSLSTPDQIGGVFDTIGGGEAEKDVEAAIDAEVARILAMSDEEILASASEEDAGWVRGFKIGLASGKSVATPQPSGDAVREALEEAFSKGAEWQKDGCDPYRIAVNSTCDAIIAALAALNGGTQG